MSEENDNIIGLDRIKELIPHRYPMLLVDSVKEVEPGQAAIGYKNLTIDEPYFQGHFPDYPVMPGVLIVETMAQTAAVLAVRALGKDAEGQVVYFMSIDNARFRKPVVPGDKLELHVQKKQSRAAVWKFEGKAMVGDKLCAEANFSAMIMNDQG
ncbi:MAG: 3-hydroxyacyl-[acyl-carrier-protein] dehydratase FabZ [Micavibrio sp.]|nr:MAG: 3-hydroxyacyl-[acyl-carrier-protein] dehydratase FabZ [Micavibrio sp.]